MRLKSIELSGFKSFAKKTQLEFASAITSVVGPNGSGKSNIAESFRFVLGEQSMKSMRGRKGEDLIWNGSPSTPRGSRAGVKLIFDNSDRALNLDFDEVALERVVYRDGGNDYLLNGSVVRLRDIAELLAQANIGASGHHIISQGEADRILSSSSKERREMIEDALGLTQYLYKREEAERKLEKTAENMREVEALRRELVPHLKFLSGQVKKIEESRVLREELSEKYLDYLKRESVYLHIAEETLKEEIAGPADERKKLDAKVAHLRAEVGKKKNDGEAQELMQLEQEGRTVSSRRDSLGRELGRIEGELAAHTRMAQDSGATVPASKVRDFAETLLNDLESLDATNLRDRVSKLLTRVRDFIAHVSSGPSSPGHSVAELEEKKKKLEAELKELEVRASHAVQAVESLRRKIESEKDASREAERELFAAMARRGELEATLVGFRAREEMLAREHEQFKSELAEASVLIGRAVLDYASHTPRDTDGHPISNADIADEPRIKQEERRRKLERMKIRLEETGLGNTNEILKEHKETVERDEFLARELTDLESSADKLNQLIEELTETLETRFVSGINKINKEFDSFFKLMFGGGTAALVIVKEKKLKRGAGAQEGEMGDGEEEERDEDLEEVEEGIEITVSLPHKRVKGLHMLSGGERALTSIALIFAMSQVNPPPFLILDETDAALDEANSRRYGDMIENLAKKSQLILISHNRETMSRAGILYGVTMGSDGASKLLSVNFEEAAAVAK
ncbi:MAG: AAA family ATPase [Candidatus Pacebacteria bacterium]|nr:AAA family ATPase [Candidatus Paceibacterota bacterium]